MKNNPYIGPRPYERGDRQNFFGRDRDARDLVGLILAEREVLFYAQSGAGKTSLLNAQVIPTLEDEGFLVLPVTRVGSSLPPTLSDGEVPNIFVLSALIGLAGADVPPDVLPRHTLLSFLREYHLKPPATGKPRPPLLILDQFEELFTTHQERWKDAAGFFQQVRELLDAEPNLGIVLAMREDHVAEVDPFVRYLPRRLAARYRMERLRREEALEAVTQPALQAGCTYAPGVAERLVSDLSRIRVQRHGEAEAEVPGPVVEPVQLQVVCQRLWENLPDSSDQVIEWDEISQFGNIDRALTDFYETALQQAMTSGVSERQLRRWFATQLITPLETRGLALRGTTETAGLPNAAVDILENRHLIRADVRAGSIWYELSHDRLVEPIVQSNRAWEAARQTPLRSAAQQWQQTKSSGLLYRDRALKDALAWVKNNPAEVEPYEQAFLEASEQAQQTRARRRRLMIGGAATAIVILLAMAGLTTLAVVGQNEARAAQAEADAQRATALSERDRADQKAREADEQRQVAENQKQVAEKESQISFYRQLAAETIARLSDHFDLALLLSIETSRLGDRLELSGTLTDTHEGRGNLLTTLATDPQVAGFLMGHHNWVQSVAFRPDGKTLASGSADNTVILWDTAAHQRLGEPLTGHSDTVFSVAFSPNGKTLASGSRDKSIILWDVSDPQTPVELGRPLTGHTDAVNSVAFSPDGKTMASGSADNSVILWDVSNAQTPIQLGAPLDGHAKAVESVAFSPDGKTLASGSDDQSVILWDVSKPQTPVKLGEPLTGYSGAVYSVAFSPDGKILASGSADQNVILWDVSNPQTPVRLGDPLTGHSSAVYSVAFSPDGKTLASGSDDRRIILWDVSNPQTPARLGDPLTGHSSYVWSVAFSPDGKTLASGSADNSIILWDLAMRQRLGAAYAGQTDAVESVAFSSDGQTVAWGSDDKTVTLWDVAKRSPLGALLTGHSGIVYGVAFSPDSKTLASGSCGKWADNKCIEGEIILWDVVTRQRLGTLIGHSNWVNSVAFSPDGKTLASGSDDQSIILWDVSTPQSPVKLSEPLTGHKGAVYSVAFSPDGKTLASGGADQSIILWDVSNPQAPTESGEPLAEHFNWVMSVAFSPDGKILASGSADNSVILWDVATHQRLSTLAGHSNRVNSVAFSPDGKTLASSSRDNSIILWDVATRQRLGTLPGHTGWVTSLAFSPDGKSLASGSYDKSVILWDVDPESWKAHICRLVGHNLAQGEWLEYFGDQEPYRKTCEQWPEGQ